MANNIFLKRGTLGQQTDITDGRGFVDDDNPTPLTRAVNAVMNKIEQRLATIDKFVEDNEGFDQIPLTMEEQVHVFENMDPKDMEILANIYGPEAVVKAKDEYLKRQFVNGGGI